MKSIGISRLMHFGAHLFARIRFTFFLRRTYVDGQHNRSTLSVYGEKTSGAKLKPTHALCVWSSTWVIGNDSQGIRIVTKIWSKRMSLLWIRWCVKTICSSIACQVVLCILLNSFRVIDYSPFNNNQFWDKCWLVFNPHTIKSTAWWLLCNY